MAGEPQACPCPVQAAPGPLPPLRRPRCPGCSPQVPETDALTTPLGSVRPSLSAWPPAPRRGSAMTHCQAVEARRPALGCTAAAQICDRDLGLRGSGRVLAGEPSSHAGRRAGPVLGEPGARGPAGGGTLTSSLSAHPPPPRRLLHAHGPRRRRRSLGLAATFRGYSVRRASPSPGSPGPGVRPAAPRTLR